MRQGYSYISGLSEAAQASVMHNTRRSGFTSGEVKSIIIGVPDKMYCIGGRLFATGSFIGQECNPKLVELVLGLNRTLYSPEFDGEEAIAGARSSFTWVNWTYTSRDAFMDVVKKAKELYHFRSDTQRDDARYEIHSLALSGEYRKFALTVKSKDYRGTGDIARATRIIHLAPNGEVTFTGDTSLHIFDNILRVALITGWAEKKVLI